MKILMVINIGSDINPYVNSLKDGLIKCGHQVVCNLDLFWNSFNNYDLIFFQWPEAIFEWNRNLIDIELLSKHFDKIKKAHIRTVITCHNLHPHNNDTKTTELYDFVYSKVDAFHHMGRYSYELLKKKYPLQHHFIAPHHIADNLWENRLNSHDAKRALHIPIDNIVISSFGAFRNNDEVLLFLNMARDVSNSHVSFLAPRIPIGHFYNGRWINKSIDYLYKFLTYKKNRIIYSGVLSDKEMDVWLSASDVVFIQRKEILNSGNVPLAFSAGKVVVGPNIGNVGLILNETRNFVFNPKDRATIKNAVLNAINVVSSNSQLGIDNYQYAKKYWSTEIVCRKIERELSSLLAV